MSAVVADEIFFDKKRPQGVGNSNKYEAGWWLAAVPSSTMWQENPRVQWTIPSEAF